MRTNYQEKRLHGGQEYVHLGRIELETNEYKGTNDTASVGGCVIVMYMCSIYLSGEVSSNEARRF